MANFIFTQHNRPKNSLLYHDDQEPSFCH